MSDSKAQKYRHLVSDRKNCFLCEDRLQNPARIEGGIFDSNHVGPYSQWQGNLDAPLLLVAQDFSDVSGFRKYRGWAGSDIQTNVTLQGLLGHAGFDIAAPAHGLPDDKLFFTNAVLCMKSGAQGGRQQEIPSKCFTNCAPLLRRTVEIVAPRVVVTLGAHALKAIRHAFPGGENDPLREVVGQPRPLTQGILLVAVYHPSPTVVNTHRCIEKMREDWKVVGELCAPTSNRVARGV